MSEWFGRQIERLLVAALVFAVASGLITLHQSYELRRAAMDNLTKTAIAEIQAIAGTEEGTRTPYRRSGR